MLFKLALRNVKRQISNYLIYFITVTLIVALIFSIDNFIFSDIISKMEKGNFVALRPIFLIVTGILCALIAFVLSYVTAFLLRRRKKEFGLYLTLGMTRGNILILFMGETLVTFLISLGFGILLGMGFYQALMAIFINFIGVKYSVKASSAVAVLVTVAMVVGMFLIASAASLLYLKFTKISELLNGEKKTEKTGKIPLLWLCLSAAGAVLLIISFVLIANWFNTEDFVDLTQLPKIKHLFYIIPMFIAAVVILPLGLAKGVMPLIVNRNEKTKSAKGTAVFTMRQLSGRLNANSVLTGVLSFLLVAAIVIPNVFLTQNGIINYLVKQEEPYDVRMERTYSTYGMYTYEGEAELNDFNEEFEIIEKYSKISEIYRYVVYLSADVHGQITEPEFCAYDVFISESDFNKLCIALGRKTVKLNGGYYVLYNTDSPRKLADFTDMPLTLGGITYSNAGSEKIINQIVMVNKSENSYVVVIPDSAVVSAPPEVLSVYGDCVGVMLKNNRYDADALQEEFNSLRFDNENDYDFFGTSQELERLYQVQKIALWLLGCLFVSAVFVLLSMAMLALKMLTMTEEDRQRYKTLWRIGADSGMIFKSLFSQMFFFYFLPFSLPFLISAPLAAILLKMVALQGVEFSWISVFGQVLGFTGVMLVLYALYFTVTYLIARQDIKRTLNSIG